MTTNPKAARYHTRRVDRPAPPDAEAGSGLLFDNHDDGFGDLDFRRREDRAAPGHAPPPLGRAPQPEPAGGVAEAPAKPYVPPTPTKPQYIKAQSITVPFAKTYLEDADDVTRYLSAVSANGTDLRL